MTRAATLRTEARGRNRENAEEIMGMVVGRARSGLGPETEQRPAGGKEGWKK